MHLSPVLGLLVSALVGDTVGDTAGDIVGDIVGSIVGDFVSNLESVGDVLGSADSIAVVSKDGADVKWVGDAVSEGSVVIMVGDLMQVGVPSYMISISSSVRSMTLPSAVRKATP